MATAVSPKPTLSKSLKTCDECGALSSDACVVLRSIARPGDGQKKVVVVVRHIFTRTTSFEIQIMEMQQKRGAI
jgi:hypothetical protein